jgi:hypothetical protein
MLEGMEHSTIWVGAILFRGMAPSHQYYIELKVLAREKD